MKRLLALAIVATAAVAGCSDSTSDPTATTAATSTNVTTGAESTTTAPESTATTAPPTSAATPVIPEDILSIFAIVAMPLDGEERLIAIADTSELRRQGLMFVEDMDDLDGMLFVFEQDSSGGFWMKNTLIPLDIAFFDVDGDFVDGFVMEPCPTDECPTYRPRGAYRYALEMPAGDMPATIAILGLSESQRGESNGDG